MAASDDGPSDAPARRLIFHTRERVQQVRNQYHEELVLGDVSQATHQRLAAIAVQYYDVLWEHHDEPQIKEEWDDVGIESIRELLGQSVHVQVDAPGDTSNTRAKTRPAVMTVPHQTLYEMTKDLDVVAKNLGFAARVGEVTADPDDALV